MTVFNVGSYPTNPIQMSVLVFESPVGFPVLQYCTESPSPPEATGMKEGLALQLAGPTEVGGSKRIRVKLLVAHTTAGPVDSGAW